MSALPLLRPPALRPGDTLGVFTPSFPAHVRFRDKYLHGLARLRALGFRVKEGALTARGGDQGYRSGTPRERAAELQELLADPEVRGVVATVGGNNSASLVPYLDFGAIRADPKVICGYSDVTSLHLAVLAFAGVSTFYGPAVMPSFGEWPEPLGETVDSWLDAVSRHRQGRRRIQTPARWSDHFRDASTDAWRTEPRRFQPNPGWRPLVPGEAAGPLLVANLSTLMAAAGTECWPAPEGRVLAIEEQDAPLAEEERHLRQLERMGALDGLAALVVGKPEAFDRQGAPFGYDDLVAEVVGDRGYPVITRFDCGHTHPMLTLAEGVRVAVTAGGDGVSFVVEEPMVA